ncbi:hypothetical protein CC2G_006676 [Coprinopsis cinerea AmutBmut pab1-1]|nr:hypothetical protein CC2G_006676 [Coprinopsis cinerea AmutBmut pab1-1]
MPDPRGGKLLPDGFRTTGRVETSVDPALAVTRKRKAPQDPPTLVPGPDSAGIVRVRGQKAKKKEAAKGKGLDFESGLGFANHASAVKGPRKASGFNPAPRVETAAPAPTPLQEALSDAFLSTLAGNKAQPPVEGAHEPRLGCGACRPCPTFTLEQPSPSSLALDLADGIEEFTPIVEHEDAVETVLRQRVA